MAFRRGRRRPVCPGKRNATEGVPYRILELGISVVHFHATTYLARRTRPRPVQSFSFSLPTMPTTRLPSPSRASRPPDPPPIQSLV